MPAIVLDALELDVILLPAQVKDTPAWEVPLAEPAVLLPWPTSPRL